MRSHLTLLVGGTILAAPILARAQTSPFVPEDVYRHLVNEISGDRSFESVRHLTHYHRTAGSRDFFAAAEWIRKAAAEAGLEDVKLVRQKWREHGWSCVSGEAWLVEPREVKLADYGEVAVSIADHSRTTHVTAEIVEVGNGGADADYQGKDVKGKIVLAWGSVATVHREAVWKRGALGVLSAMTNRHDAFDAPDQVAWGRLPYDARDVAGVADGTPSAFAVMISPRRARSLQRLMASEGKPLKVKVDIVSEYPPQQEQAMVEAWIRGTEIRDQQIVLTAHIQEEKTSANDDGSGCANLLEIGRALTRLIREGRIPRPRRDIRFWWVNELASQPQYFRDSPGEPRKMLINLNQDMVGARQSLRGRVQYASRLPWSLPHVLDDVVENVLTFVRDGNTSLLTMRGTTVAGPFTREVVAVKGSREPFRARMVPYHGSTDHHAFTPARIGVPATSLTNWPDDTIHSTADDLEALDATQLERNAVVVAAVALYFAGLDDERAAALAAYGAARARSRIAADLATAIAHVSEAAPEGRAAAFRAARRLVVHSHRKEAAALLSVRRLSPKGRAAAYAADAASRLGDAGQSVAALDRAFAAITGKTAPNVELSREESAMERKVFVPLSDLGAMEDALRRAKSPAGLHAMMRFEVYNFADGKRNALEVYEAVAAEALSAGGWYYGPVRPSNVLETLEEAAKAGAFTVKENP